jgi:hypothetical protein
MITRALLVAAGFLAISFTSFAQQADSFSDLNNREAQLVSLTLANTESFAFPDAITPATFAWNSSIVDVALPKLVVRPTQRVAAVSAISPKDVQSEPISELRKPLFDYAHGEVGVMFGMSASDHFRGDFEAGYLTGTVGNEHLQISAGASYERSDFRRR